MRMREEGTCHPRMSRTVLIDHFVYIFSNNVRSFPRNSIIQYSIPIIPAVSQPINPYQQSASIRVAARDGMEGRKVMEWKVERDGKTKREHQNKDERERTDS
jgi:hypothetical protein